MTNQISFYELNRKYCSSYNSTTGKNLGKENGHTVPDEK